MTEAYDKLKRLLDELLRFDRADLDFGIYHITHRRREQVSRFLGNDLVPQVCEEPEPSSPSGAAAPK